MATLEDIREGLAANLGTIQGCQVSAYALANATPPCLEVFPDPTETILYHQAMGNGLATWRMQVRGTVANNSDVAAQKLMDEWIAPSGARSVFAAIEADKTLGGVVKDLMVMSCDGYQEYVRTGSNTSYFAATWTVQVFN